MRKFTKAHCFISASLFAFLLLYLFPSVIATPLIYGAIFSKPAAFSPSLVPGLVDYEQVKSAYPRKNFFFQSADGSKLMAYSYDNPSTDKTVIVLPGIGSSADAYLAQDLYFYDHGYDVVTFDQYALGSSEGTWERGMAEEAVDFGFLLEQLKANGKKEFYLFGHSQGAYSACVYLNEDHPEIKAVSAVSGFDSSEGTVLSFARDRVSFLADLSAPFVTSYQRGLFGARSSWRAVDGINRSGIPFLLSQGQEDETIRADREAITHFSSEITNPHVSFYSTSGLQGSHSGILYSLEADTYQKQVKADYLAYKKEEGGSLTSEQVAAFFSKVDDQKYSELNPELMAKTLALFAA